MNMKTTLTKFLAITVAFIVYATILFLIMVTLPLHAQTVASAGNGAARLVAVTDSAPATNAVAVTATKTQKSSPKYPPVQIDETGIHVGGQNPVNIHPGKKGFDVVPIVAILGVFGMPVAIVGLVFYFIYRRNKMMHETLRAMIEKGMPVTPELLADLKATGYKTKSQSRNHRLLPGLVLTGLGTALLISHPGYHHSGGWILLFIGVAFLIVWAVERTDKNDDQPPKQ